MAIFISYSHTDKDFVDELAAHLVSKKAHVWLDRWELCVGDSLVDRIQEAMDDAHAIIVVLSSASVQSEWCRRELSSGILRELESREVLVLPVLKEKCDIPLFLRGKVYADFRHTFEQGFKDVLEALAKYTSDTKGRIATPDYNADWAIDWGEKDGHFIMHFLFAQHSERMPYTIVTEISVLTNPEATRRYNRYADAGLDWYGRQVLVAVIAPLAEKEDIRVLLTDNKPQTLNFHMHDPKTGGQLELIISCRWLGEDTGKDVLVDCSFYFRLLRETLVCHGMKPSPEQATKIAEIMRST